MHVDSVAHAAAFHSHVVRAKRAIAPFDALVASDNLLLSLAPVLRLFGVVRDKHTTAAFSLCARNARGTLSSCGRRCAAAQVMCSQHKNHFISLVDRERE